MLKYVYVVTVVSVALLALSFGVLFININAFTSLVEAYYNTVFYPGAERSNLFFLHPLVIGIAFIMVWIKTKETLRGGIFLKGMEFGLYYAFIATLPSMWITFSSMDVSVLMVFLWLCYGLLQATVAGWILAGLKV